MVPKPRYVLPLNFREADLPLLNQIFSVAKKQDSNITSVVRSALNEFAERQCTLDGGGTHKIDEFCSPAAASHFNDMLTPAELKSWEDGEVLAACAARAG